MKLGRKSFFALALLLFLSLPGTGHAAYQITETQLAELTQVFSELRTQQTMQQEQIEKLRTQLVQSETSMRTSETQLAEANSFLKESADRNRRTEARLERQRNTWAIVAGLIAGWAVVR